MKSCFPLTNSLLWLIRVRSRLDFLYPLTVFTMPRPEETEGYLDRLRTVLYKANVLRLYGADVYIVVRRRNKITEYSSSSTDAHWPPSRTQIVSLASQYNHIRLTTFRLRRIHCQTGNLQLILR